MTSKYMKRCSTSLIIRFMQIKTTKIFYFTLVRTAVIKSYKIKFGKDVKKRESLDTTGENINWYSHYGK